MRRILGYVNPKILMLSGIIFLAFVLRIYRLEDHTEFLGDQGSAGIVIQESWKSKLLPLTGPAFSTGQSPGAAYYYLIAPFFILSDYNPYFPALFMVLLSLVTVYLLYKIGSKLFNVQSGIIAAVLYASSSVTVWQNRNLWNPTPVPFFTALALYSMVKIYKDRDYFFLIFLGFSNAVLLQLHFTCLLTVFFSAVFWLYILYRRDSEDNYLEWLLRSVYGIGAFLLTLGPYLWYEANHGFTDVISLLKLLKPDDLASGFGFRFAHNPLLILGMVFGPVADRLPDAFWILIPLILFYLIMRTRYRWLIFLNIWLISGIAVMSIFRDNVHDHYLYFIQILPFVLTGILVSLLFTRKPVAGYLIVTGFVVWNLSHTDMFGPYLGDIPRIRAVTDYIRNDTAQKPFSFTLVASRSFSDLHYRFYFLKNSIMPSDITGSDYGKLYLICEKPVCPLISELSAQGRIQVTCFDHRCSMYYPVLELTGWKYDKTFQERGAVVYSFIR